MGRWVGFKRWWETQQNTLATARHENMFKGSAPADPGTQETPRVYREGFLPTVCILLKPGLENFEHFFTSV